LRAVREEVKPWLVAVLRAPAREVASPPASWTTFSAAHAATLDGLRGLLATGDVPIWERGSLARLEPDPWQWNGRHLAAGFRLQELLVADALAATASGDRERALASLEAAWTHARSLEEIPSLVADLQWVSCRVEQVGALRLVGGPAPGWDERLRLDGERQRFLDVAAIASRRPLETRAMRRAAVVAEDSGPFDRLPASPLLPIVRWLETDWSDAPRRFHVAIRPERARCLPVSEESLLVRLGDVHLSSPLSIVLPNLVNAAERFESLARHAALTRRVLALDRVRAATGRWPGELPAVEVDDCPDLRWRCETRADGSVLLALDPELDWSERHVRVLLPERVELGTDGG
jgi:hypothetical protein